MFLDWDGWGVRVGDESKAVPGAVLAPCFPEYRRLAPLEAAHVAMGGRGDDWRERVQYAGGKDRGNEGDSSGRACDVRHLHSAFCDRMGQGRRRREQNAGAGRGRRKQKAGKKKKDRERERERGHWTVAQQTDVDSRALPELLFVERIELVDLDALDACRCIAQEGKKAGRA